VYSGEEEKENWGPLLVMIHGGGFCLGMAEPEEVNCRKWVENHGAVAVSIEHRLTPEAKFPVPVENYSDGLRWIVANSKTLMADPEKGFILGGTSVDPYLVS
jgi:acetyl esterase/lipase